MKGYNKIRKKAKEVLTSNLPQNLYYHTVDHAFDVLNVCNEYIRREKIDKYKAKLLRIGALLHDIGYTISNINHEDRSVEIAKKYMIEYGFSKEDIEVVKGLILATRMPQTPKNYLEKNICDADLDYLGRNEFYTKSNLLFKELKYFSNIKNIDEWNKYQIKFLETHKYHTKFAQKNRQPQKEKRIKELKLLLKKK